MGKASINGPFSMAMLNNQRVKCLTIWVWIKTSIHPAQLTSVAGFCVTSNRLNLIHVFPILF